MKLITITLAAAALVLSLGVKTSNNTNLDQNADQLFACLWFPICRDPDFNNNVEESDNLLLHPELDMKDELYACLWFPICRDPDMPFLTSDEQSAAAVA